jgi:hypothetical protein
MATTETSSPTFLRYITLYDVIYVVEYQNSEKLGVYLPRSSIARRFRTFIGDEGFEGGCEFVDGHHRSMRAWLTADEIQTLIKDCSLEYVPEGADVFDQGVGDSVELGNVLYFKANTFGHQALFVALPKGHNTMERERQITVLKNKVVPR